MAGKEDLEVLLEGREALPAQEDQEEMAAERFLLLPKQRALKARLSVMEGLEEMAAKGNGEETENLANEILAVLEGVEPEALVGPAAVEEPSCFSATRFLAAELLPPKEEQEEAEIAEEELEQAIEKEATAAAVVLAAAGLWE